MNTILSTLIVTSLIIQSVNAKINSDSLPDVMRVGEDGVVHSELIFDLTTRPTPQCHASTIVETPTGIVAAWFAGTHEKNPDVGIWISRHVNGRWIEPVEVVNGVQSMNVRYPCWNPVLFQPKDGPLMLFYKVGPDPTTWWGMLTTSYDGGHTWSWPVKLGEHFVIGHLLGPVKNKPIQLADGTIICPSSTEAFNEAKTERYWKIHFEVSRDLGKTWDVVGPINNGIDFDTIQPSILTYPNGDLQLLCRTRQQVVGQSWSKDGGRSWSPIEATHLPNPNAGTDAVTLKDGRQLLVYNHSTRSGNRQDNTFRNGRQILNVALSQDGKHWNTVLTLENESNDAGYSYPAVIQTDDGMVHITYTWRRLNIKHVIIDPKEL